VHDIIRGWRRLLDRHGERTMVGEVYLLEPAKVAAYHGTALDELPLAFNFAFQWTPWDAALFRARVEEVERLWPSGAQPTYVLSSHDAPRHRTRFDHPAYGEARARVAALLLLTLRGTPFLYYGEELGMRDGEIPPERICDPVGKRFPALGRDPERTPMPWDGSVHAGFSPEAPWLPLGAEWPTVNVAAQRDDPASMLSFYRRAIWWRKSSPALREGSLRVLDGPENTLVFVRQHAAQRVLVALNFADAAVGVALPDGGKIALATSNDAAIDGRQLALGPNQGAVVAFGA
jgi:glycosidase